MILRDLLEPDSAIKNPGTNKLQRPLANQRDLQAFLDLTHSQNLSELLQVSHPHCSRETILMIAKHTFLSLSKGPQTLIPYVLVANEIGLRRAEIYPSVRQIL